MQDKIVIYLESHDVSHPSWAVIDAASIVKEYVSHGNPDELTYVASGKEIIVIVPAEDVLLLTAKLPKMSRSRLAQALPFALEDQVVADVNDLLFVAGESQLEGELPVAVVARAKMQEWLTLLQSWNVKPDLLLPLSLVLPFENDSWHILVDTMVHARVGQFQGFSCDQPNFNEFLHMALSAAPQMPRHINIHNYSSNHTSAKMLDTSINIKEDVNHPDRMIAKLALYAVKAPVINLLQGDFASKKSRFPQMQKMLRTTAYVGAAWIFILIFSPIVSYFILSQRISNIDAQIAQIYKRNFPQSASIVAPKLRMEEKLQKLSTQIGENRFLLLLGYVGKGMQKAPSVKLKRMDFQTNQLTVELTAESSEDFSGFSDYLSQQGLNVKQQNANLADARVNATLVIE